jgi:uncharacterized protein YprB with RNaseH-like and TPR domain
MNAIADKLSRVAALRPNPRVSTPSISKCDLLIQELGGELRKNSLGAHVVVRRCFDQPQQRPVEAQAFRFLAPDAPEPLCDLSQWLFFDTETTGLAGGTGAYAFLIGLGWWESDGFVVEQFFMRDHSEEPSLLHGILDRFAQRPILVSFNGKAFDWPLLQTRFQMTRTGTAPNPLFHLDLLHPSRQLWRLRLQSVALTQLEKNILGLHRGPDIPSEIIPQIYFDFLRGGSPESMAEVFRHNQWDLCGLASLALHVCNILADPENAGSCAEELFGLSRLVQRKGAPGLAGRIYRKALDGGLPPAAEQIAHRELALLAKRGRDYKESNEFWEKLLGGDPEGLNAYEQLAIYYEHKERLPEKAAVLVRESIVKLQESFRAGRISSAKYMNLYGKFQHRLARLNKKNGIVSPLSTFICR